MAYLECNDLKRIYKDFSLDVSFSLEKGELLCIVGPSGSGKSTLLSLIAGIESPDSGSIILDGRDVTKASIQKRGIGMVFQDFSLFPSMDVAHNIQYGMKDMDEKEKRQYTSALLHMVGLQGYEKRRVFELSGGEAQRVALARAVAAKPRILLLDEPLSALDAPLRKHLRTVIRQIHDTTGIAMVHVTHDRDEAFAIADRIMIMKGGHVECEGTPQELYKSPKSLFSAFFTGEGSSIQVSQLSTEPSKTTIFFRPEAIELDRTEPSEDYLMIPDVRIQGTEYTGAGYQVKLIYKGNPITAYTRTRPVRETADVFIRKSEIIELAN